MSVCACNKNNYIKTWLSVLDVFLGNFSSVLYGCLYAEITKKIIKVLEKFGAVSYELYLTHVAVRALMNIVGLKTFYFQNYVLCVLISLLLTAIIVNLQRRVFYAS